ncbi:DUF4347 domain-containing protein [Fulvivirgaceae bacterium BMA10]|uniref:DUF4347 domain-containing protein n=1 Tax=Splendidivirga corallicola TaxID=3051826 RepID=A0ABT8KGX3_9BACT|nr:DUF4347 domain-containing protein [Fulvivirgaceae bacterium BMA10]
MRRFFLFFIISSYLFFHSKAEINNETNLKVSQSDSEVVVFIDPAIEGYQQLINGIHDAKVITLDSRKDGVAQITQHLNAFSDLQSIHIISHGKPGSFQLGNTNLSYHNISQFEKELKSWQLACSENADLLIYGCRVVSGKYGESLINELHTLTELDIAASEDHTGNTLKRGDWVLESKKGDITTPIIFDNKTISNYPYVFTSGGPDSFGYTYIDSDETGGTIAFEDISGTGTATGLGDEGETTVSMSFDFDFYGTTSRDLRISDNGTILFGAISGTDTRWNNRGSFPTSTYTYIIAPYYDDFYPAASGGQGDIYYQELGTAPNRRFIVQWDDVEHWDLRAGTNGVTFQVVLYEGSNNIDFVYQDTDFGNAGYNDGSNATIGLNKDATDALQYSFNSASLSGVTSVRYSYPTSTTWYSYQTGNWNDPNTWTLDGSVVPSYDNPSSQTPGTSDIVVITSGRTVTVQSSTNNLTIGSITITGNLDLTTSTGHNFGTIRGSGRILMSADNFPGGNATHFVTKDQGEGTVVYQGGGHSLSTDRTFYNVEVDMDATNDIVTLLSDYTINGNLTVKQGIFQINNNSANGRTLSVTEDVEVQSNGQITLGTGNATHNVTLSGDLTNAGTVEFTNQTSVPTTNPTDGIVNVTFDNASAHQTVTCNGPTDFYRIIVDKGTDKTYIVDFQASATSNFNLFGRTNNSGTGTEPNILTNNALDLRAGTIKIGTNINIPNMNSTGTTYTIDSDARLWVENGTVNFGGEWLRVAGELQVSGTGQMTINDHGIYLRDAGGVIVEGNGILNAALLGPSGNGAGHSGFYMQSGGTANIGGRDNDNYGYENYTFSLPYGGNSFTMTGGTLIVDHPINLEQVANDGGGILIGVDNGNYNVTGGKVIMDASRSGVEYKFNSTAPFWDLEIRNSAGGSEEVLISAYTNDGTDPDITSLAAQPLVVLNDLTIAANADFNASGFDVTIGADFTIASGATYTHGVNTTTINGSKNSNFDFAALQTFNNFTINKSDGTDAILIANGAGTAMQINGELRVEKGNLDYDTYTISAQGNVYVADTLGFSNDSGKLLLDGGTTQTITSVGGVFGSVEINNANGISLSGNTSITSELKLNGGVFDINTSKLTMAGASASITGTFSTTAMIQTDGNASDGGLEMYLDANETLTFPIGTDANADVRYTPLVAVLSSFSDDGYISVSPADEVLPTTNGSGGTMLSYYWHVEHRDFTTVPKVTSYTFSGSENDDGTGSAASYPNSWRAGKVLSANPFTRSHEDNTSINNPTGHDINFDGDGTPFDVENADYSAGPSNRFNGQPDVYYSQANGNWNTTTTWRIGDPDTGSNGVPTAGSIVVIRNGHRVNVNAGTEDVGSIQFEHDYGTSPTPDSENVSRLQFWIAGTFELGVVTGTGMISFSATADPTVNGDFGDFGTNVESYFLYFRNGGSTTYTLNNIPTPIPSLMVESASYTIDQAITTNANLVVQGNGDLIPNQDIEVLGDLWVGMWVGGTFHFPSTGAAITLTVNGDVDFTVDPFSDPRDRDLVVDDSGNDLEHRLIVKGDILHGAGNGYDLDLYNASNVRPRAILELQGESDNSYSRTSTSVPEFYRIELDKGTDQSNTFTFSDDFTLSGPTNGNTKALELQNGRLVLNDADIDINLTTGGADFSIANTTVLEVTAGTVNVGGDDSGITLDGLLRINGGTVDMDDAVNNGNNYLQYSSSGNATLEISSGTLTIGSQLRRRTTTSDGILLYTQTGGSVVVGKNAAPEATRGVFEILNAGSDFTHTGGSLTIVRENTNNPSIATVFLDPATSDVAGSTLTIGNTDTPTNQDIGINSMIPLNNLEINGSNSPRVILNVNALTVGGNLTLAANNTLDANGLGLTITGDFTHNGTYTANNNTLTFNSGSSQTYSGSGSGAFYNMTKSGSGTLNFSRGNTVNNVLNISQGTFATGTQSIDLNGKMIHDATHTSTSGNGIVFSGTSAQTLERSGVGTSTLGIITIDNSSGVSIPDGNGYNFNITNRLRLSSGVFDIGSSLLTLGTSADILEVNTFSSTNMIETNNSFTDNGVRKEFLAGTTTDFTFPVGEGIYTPVTINLSDVGHTTGTTAGNLTVRPANEFHPVVNDGSDALGSGDINNVLQYYWTIDANNFDNNFVADLIFTYDDTHVKADEAGMSESDYITARILSDNNPSGNINKNGGTVNTGANTLTFGFSSVDHEGISGDYFAGIDQAIPSQVPTYTATTDGNVDAAIYTPVVPGGGAPQGAIVVVDPGVTVTINGNGVSLYQTQINGTLDVGTTVNHRLGTVTGTGTLRISGSTLPNGFYNDFFSCSGGGLEYSGSTDYDVLGNITTLSTLTFSGTGERRLANNDINVCNDLTVNGPTFINDNGRDITVQGDLILQTGTFETGVGNNNNIQGNLTLNGGTFDGMTGGTNTVDGNVSIAGGTLTVGSGGSLNIEGNLSFTSGTFNGGSGLSKIVLNGSGAQDVSGTFTGASQMHRLEVNNGNGVTFSGNVDINNELLLTNGIIANGSNNLTLNASATVTPSTGSSSSYVNGALRKIMNVSSSFTFPVGSGSRWGYASVNNVSEGGLTWQVEYFNQGAINDAAISNMTPASSSILTMSGNEYWKIADDVGTAPSGSVTAEIGLSWDGSSDVSATQTEREQLEIMAWNTTNSNWDNFGGANFSAGHTQSGGSLTSSTNVTFSERIITLGSTDSANPLPIELIEFNAVAVEGEVKLDWKTASETNNDFFEIQRSEDGENWEVIGILDGAGTTSVVQSYDFTDQRPLFGQSYYRLRQIDFDGQFSYSWVETVYNEFGENNIDARLYPNPTSKDNMNLQVLTQNRENVVSVTLVDLMGKKFFEQKYDPSEFNKDQKIHTIAELRSGIYILIVEQGTKQIKEKIIIE